MPVTGCHSVIDRPDSVRRVMPPITTIRKIMAQQNRSHHAIARSPRSAGCAALAVTAGKGKAPPASVFIPDIVVGYKCRRQFTAFTGIASRVSLPRPLRRITLVPSYTLSNPGESRDLLFDNPEADRWTPASAGVAARSVASAAGRDQPPGTVPAGRLAQ